MPIINLRAESRNEKGEVRPAPEALALSGPILPVTLTLSDASQRAYSEQGKPLPETVSGLAMIDTGATSTCFDQDSARAAGLPVVGTAKMSSTTHADQEMPVFAGKMMIAGQIVIDVDRGMGANLSSFDGLVALIGRDLLSSAVFTYNGPDGSICIAI